MLKTDNVYFLSHPVAPDADHSYDENIRDALRWLRICLDAGLPTIMPWFEHCTVLDDTNATHREAGLRTDCLVIKALRRTIMTGHKISSGMKREQEALASCQETECETINLIGMTHQEGVEFLRQYVEAM